MTTTCADYIKTLNVIEFEVSKLNKDASLMDKYNAIENLIVTNHDAEYFKNVQILIKAKEMCLHLKKYYIQVIIQSLDKNNTSSSTYQIYE